MVKEIVKNIKKDFLIEFRSPASLFLGLSFACVTTISMGLIFAGTPAPVQVQAILLWVIIFFSAMNTLSHSFIREEDQGTVLLLRISSSPESIFLAKLFFNIATLQIIILAVLPLFILSMQLDVHSPWIFLLSSLAGGLSLSCATVLLSVMVAKAGKKTGLFTILSFPLILPVLWVSVSLTQASLNPSPQPTLPDFIFLLAFSALLVSMSILLFRQIWFEE